jgi:hypothetical protein
MEDARALRPGSGQFEQQAGEFCGPVAGHHVAGGDFPVTPSSTTSRRSSYSTALTTSVMWVVRLTCGLVRLARSPMPVRLGVKTS